jgi:Mn2+/Fe2+ NRAMP family transporter
VAFEHYKQVRKQKQIVTIMVHPASFVLLCQKIVRFMEKVYGHNMCLIFLCNSCSAFLASINVQQVKQKMCVETHSCLHVVCISHVQQINIKMC